MKKGSYVLFCHKQSDCSNVFKQHNPSFNPMFLSFVWLWQMLNSESQNLAAAWTNHWRLGVVKPHPSNIQNRYSTFQNSRFKAFLQTCTRYFLDQYLQGLEHKLILRESSAKSETLKGEKQKDSSEWVKLYKTRAVYVKTEYHRTNACRDSNVSISVFQKIICRLSNPLFLRF